VGNWLINNFGAGLANIGSWIINDFGGLINDFGLVCYTVPNVAASDMDQRPKIITLIYE